MVTALQNDDLCVFVQTSSPGSNRGASSDTTHNNNKLHKNALLYHPGRATAYSLYLVVRPAAPLQHIGALEPARRPGPSTRRIVITPTSTVCPPATQAGRSSETTSRLPSLTTFDTTLAGMTIARPSASWPKSLRYTLCNRGDQDPLIWRLVRRNQHAPLLGRRGEKTRKRAADLPAPSTKTRPAERFRLKSANCSEIRAVVRFARTARPDPALMRECFDSPRRTCLNVGTAEPCSQTPNPSLCWSGSQ